MGVVTAVATEFEPLPRRFPAAAGGSKAKPPERGTVCVTSAGSFLGSALLRLLLRRGYQVRAAVDSEGDAEKLRDEDDVMRVMIVDVMEVESLRMAFDGCVSVFHTSGFADPQGVSGYTKPMADMEAVIGENVLEACVRAPSVRKCLFTSSLLACTWQRDCSRRTVVDERCWSDEGLCREKKLWLALGKTMAEKAAWRKARGTRVKLATICPALVVGDDFHINNTTPSIAYLKGGNEMFKRNILATVDVDKVAEAHVLVYDSMNSGIYVAGRYICFDNVIDTTDKATMLERNLHFPDGRISNIHEQQEHQELMLSNKKLSTLANRTIRCFHYLHHFTMD